MAEEKKKNTIWIFLFVILALVAVGLAFYFLYWRRRHPLSSQGDDIQVGDAVITTFSAANTAMCATDTTPHNYNAYGVVTALSGSQATVFWTAMYDTQDSTCAFVRGAQKGVGSWEATYMGIGTTAPTASGVQLKTVLETSELSKLSPTNY